LDGKAEVTVKLMPLRMAGPMAEVIVMFEPFEAGRPRMLFCEYLLLIILILLEIELAQIKNLIYNNSVLM
jgi:hypothetical protein